MIFSPIANIDKDSALLWGAVSLEEIEELHRSEVMPVNVDPTTGQPYIPLNGFMSGGDAFDS